MPKSPEPNVYQLRVVLLRIRPIIWRRLLVRGDSTIAHLHDILQISFGWSDDHLHRFLIHGKQYGLSYFGGITFRDDPRRIKLSDLGLRVKEKFLYEYDFIDQWQHLIRVEAILPVHIENSVSPYFLTLTATACIYAAIPGLENQASGVSSADAK